MYSFTKGRIYEYMWCVCVCMCKGIIVHNCLPCFTDSTLIMDVTPRPLCWWIIDGGSTVRIKDCAMIDECFVLPFFLYIWLLDVSPYLSASFSNNGAPSTSCASFMCIYCSQQRHFFQLAPLFSSSSITPHLRNNDAWDRNLCVCVSEQCVSFSCGKGQTLLRPAIFMAASIKARLRTVSINGILF